MKVDPNEPVYPSDMRDSFEKKHRGIPIRLAIAAQIMAGFASDRPGLANFDAQLAASAKDALKCTDFLIAAFNEDAA